MKKIFFALVFIPFIANAQEIKYQSDDGNLVLYKLNGTEPCLARKNLEVYQADGTSALVCEINNFECKYSGKQLMAIMPSGDAKGNSHYYYDGEIIPNPVGKCAKQIGVYRYQTVGTYKDGTPRYKTVPVISILDK